MRKTAILRSSQSPAARHGSLRLSHETIRTLRAADLARAVSGCDTTSYTTDSTVHTDSGTSTKTCV